MLTTRSYYNFYTGLILILMCCLFIISYFLPQVIADKFNEGPQLGFWFVTFLLYIVIIVRITVKKMPSSISVTVADVILFLLLLVILFNNGSRSIDAFNNNKTINFCLLATLYYITALCMRECLRHQAIITTISLTLFITTALVTVTLSVHGICQYFSILMTNNLYFPLTGPFINPARLSNYLIALLPGIFATFIFFPKGNKYYTIIKWSALFIFIVGIIAVGLSYCRAAWVGLVVSLLYILFFKFRGAYYRYFKNYRVWFILSLLVFVCAGALYILKPNSANGRLLIWKISGSMIKQHPMLGIGYGQFENKYNLEQAAYFSTHKVSTQEIWLADSVRYPYNIFLQCLLEIGLVGLMIFVVFFYNLMTIKKNTLPVQNYIQIVTLAGITATLVCGVFSYPFDILPVQIVMFIFSGILGGYELKWTYTIRNIIALKIASLFAITALSLLSFIIFKQGRTQFLAYKKWQEIAAKKKDMRDFDCCWPVLSANDAFLEFYTNHLIVEKKYQQVVEVLGSSFVNLRSPELLLNYGKALSATKRLESAEKAIKTAVYMVPNRFYSKYVLSLFYLDTKQYQKAFSWASSIDEAQEKVPSCAIEVIKSDAKRISTEALLHLK